MKRFFIYLLLSLGLAVSSARTMRDFLVTEPGSVFLSISVGTRMDMIDYYDAGRIEWLTGLTGGEASLQVLTDDYCRVQTSAVRTVEARLLTTRCDTAILVIETVGLPIADSRVTCYDSAWKPIDIKRVMKYPRNDDWFKPGTDASTRDSVARAVRFVPVKWTFEGEKRDTLVATPLLADFHAGEQATQSLMRRAIRDRLTFSIKGNKIKTVK